jgi:hypothetical protein
MSDKGGGSRVVSVNLVHNLYVNKANKNVSNCQFGAGIARAICHLRTYVFRYHVKAGTRVQRTEAA